MKNYLSSVFVNNREPREYHWYKLIDYSFDDFYIIDSTEDIDFTSDKLVLTARAVNEYLGVEVVEVLEESIDSAESEVTDMEAIPYEDIIKIYSDYVASDGGDILDEYGLIQFFDDLSPTPSKPYVASSVKYLAPIYIDSVVDSLIEYFLLHKAYVDYVVADGGQVISKTDTLNLFKEIV
jgi:hypothetical protein